MVVSILIAFYSSTKPIERITSKDIDWGQSSGQFEIFALEYSPYIRLFKNQIFKIPNPFESEIRFNYYSNFSLNQLLVIADGGKIVKEVLESRIDNTVFASTHAIDLNHTINYFIFPIENSLLIKDSTKQYFGWHLNFKSLTISNPIDNSQIQNPTRKCLTEGVALVDSLIKICTLDSNVVMQLLPNNHTHSLPEDGFYKIKAPTNSFIIKFNHFKGQKDYAVYFEK